MNKKRWFKPPSEGSTQSFYSALLSGNKSRGLWGKESRFNPTSIASKSSVEKHFKSSVLPFFTGNEKVLDLGCGPGGFLSVMSPLCKEITGADISKDFVDATSQVINAKKFENATAVHIADNYLPFNDCQFDVVVMVDVIHHMEDINLTLNEVSRVLQPGGRVLIFEPNKLNPALFLMCLFDRNEWGLLSLGTKKTYRNLLDRNYKIEQCEYNGLLIGPDSKLALFIADVLTSDRWKAILGFLSPKLFISATRR